MSQYKEEINHLKYYIKIERRFIIKAKDKLSKIKKRKDRYLVKEIKIEIQWREDNLNAYLKEQKELRKRIKKQELNPIIT